MNQDRFNGIRLQLGGTLKQHWGRLTGDPRTAASGRSDRFAGRILEQRANAAQESARQLQDFMRRNRNWWDLSGH